MELVVLFTSDEGDNLALSLNNFLTFSLIFSLLLRNSADCYSYLSNRITLLVRQCLKRYYDCWLVCDDPTCGRRSMQQPLCGLACTEDCHGRLVQEFNEESLHTELKYIEALFDFPRSVKRRVEAQLLADGNSK